jgi:hypothetical protein
MTSLHGLMRWLLLVHFSILITNAQQLFGSASVNFCIEPYCYCTDSNTLHCYNFTRFEQLDFRRTSNRLFRLVELRPLVQQIDINERLSFNGLNLNGRLSMSNIRSINAFYNPFRQIKSDRLELAFFNSYFNFIGTTGIDAANYAAETAILNECRFTVQANNYDFVFGHLKLDEFVICNVYFERTMCPIVFRNSVIKDFIVTDPIGAFGFEHLKTPKNDAIYILNAVISQIDFAYAADNLIQPQWLDADYILNPDLFAYLDRINLNSARRLAYIKEDTFKKLPSVKKFEINNVRLKDLLTYNRQWLKNLNYRMIPFDLDYVSLNDSMSQNIFQLMIWVNENEWDFNDEKDICLFRNFPHQRLVFPFLLFSKPTLPCTCTIYWLYKHFPRYQGIYNLNQHTVPFHCFAASNWDKCHFETLFNRYCPDSVPDPLEPFTTLRPTTDFIYITSTNTKTSYTSTAPHTLPTLPPTWSTSYYSTPYYSTTHRPPPPPPPPPPPYSTTTPHRPPIYTSSQVGHLIAGSDCSLSLVAFYLAIALSVIAAFIVAALIVLYYKVLRKNNKFQPGEVCQTLSHSELCRDEYI